jgi:hypothetical protein
LGPFPGRISSTTDAAFAFMVHILQKRASMCVYDLRNCEHLKSHRTMKKGTLLVMTAVLEAAAGIALVALPDMVADLLLGTALDAPAARVVARIAGAALFALGLACWLARRDGQSDAARGLVAALLLYNAVVAAMLVGASIVQGLSGIGLWPAVVLHAAMAGWCILCLRPRDPSTPGT